MDWFVWMLAACTVASTLDSSGFSATVNVPDSLGEAPPDLGPDEVAGDEADLGVGGVDGVDAGLGKGCGADGGGHFVVSSVDWMTIDEYSI